MVATGWVWSRAHGERESSFFRREREREERIQEREEKLSEGVKRGNSGYLNSALRDLPMVVLTN